MLCRVISWEPVPHFRAFLEYNRQLNHLEDLIDIRATAVAEVSGVIYNLTVPSRGIWGTAGIGGLNIDRYHTLAVQEYHYMLGLVSSYYAYH